MSRQLDREGVFKALPVSWGVQASAAKPGDKEKKKYGDDEPEEKRATSQSVALVVTFRILAQFEDGAWSDWTQYEEHQISGWFWIVKRDGSVSATTVENLAASIGWDGNLANLTAGPPEVVCQITVAEEEWNGKLRLKVQWLNPEDFVAGPKTALPAEVQQLNVRYGSLLRAAAATAKPKALAQQKPAPPPARRPEPEAAAAVGDDGLPFERRPGASAASGALGRRGDLVDDLVDGMDQGQ